MNAKWNTPDWACEWWLPHSQASVQANNPAENKQTWITGIASNTLNVLQNISSILHAELYEIYLTWAKTVTQNKCAGVWYWKFCIV